MTEDQYRELFETMGIEAGELRHVLRYGGLPRRVHFNRNKDVGIYFSAHGDDEAWYPSSLWEKIDPYLVQKAVSFANIPTDFQLSEFRNFLFLGKEKSRM